MKKIDIVIFAGQSNMQGQSECLLNGEIIENSFEYKLSDDEIVPLKNPVGEDIRYDQSKGYRFDKDSDPSKWLKEHVIGSACYGHTNLVPSFCGAYQSKTKKRVLAVPAAKGSTAIAAWLPETDGYKMIVKKSAAAIRKAKEKYTVDKIYFVWLQGESDAIEANSKSYYKEKLTILNSALRKDLSIDKFCIIRVGRFTNDDRDFKIINAQSEICKTNNDFLMLTEITVDLNQQPQYMNQSVNGHYSASGLELLGRTAGEALGELEIT